VDQRLQRGSVGLGGWRHALGCVVGVGVGVGVGIGAGVVGRGRGSGSL
jgi:hypothetical protein